VAGGLDHALHGSRKLHGWGQFGFADPTLLIVRGFEPGTNKFKYAVNPLFGSSTQIRNSQRTPFTVTLDFRLELGPDRETQYLSSLMRDTPEGAELRERQVKQRIARANTQLDQFALVKDTIKLTDAQIDSLKAISRRFALTRDSIVTALARYLIACRGDHRGEAVR